MQNNLIIRMSNGLGNQLFMYATAYALSKKLNRKLLIDDESAFESRKNISFYSMNIFNISASLANENLKFINTKGYILRKILKKIDYLKKKKSFFVEQKDKNKITSFNESFLQKKFSKNLFLEGHFETEKYFIEFKKDLLNEFDFTKKYIIPKNKYIDQIKSTNSVCVCVRQHRFNEGLNSVNSARKIKKSWNFTLEQIRYIKKSVQIIKRRTQNPKFFLWSNDLSHLHEFFPETEFVMIDVPKSEKEFLDFVLMTYAKNFILAPTSYNWWGAWLAKNKNIILRPSDNLFSDFFLNNKNFWSEDWDVVN